MRFCTLNGPCWYLVCLVETSGDLARYPCLWSSDDDAVRKELALRLPGLEKTWQRPPSFTSQPSYRICSTPIYIASCSPRNLLPAPRSKQHHLSITSSLLLCLSTYCNCIPLFYTSASAPSTTSQSQNEEFNCSARCRCELRRCPEHQ